MKTSASRSSFSNPRVLSAFAFCSVGFLLAGLNFASRAAAQSSFSGGSFTAAASMTSPRHFHTATLLGNGKVLLAGSQTGSGITNTAELFDPASSTFTSLSPNTMTSPRRLHTATLLPSGKVLLAGGQTGTGTSNTAELFDPASGTFTTLSSNTMTSGRHSHTATLLRSGKVLLAGGYTGSVFANTAELFDPASGTFTAVPNTMTTEHYQFTATLLPNGKVLIAGGGSATSGSINTAELFDPASETFTLLPAMNSARTRHTAALLPSGKVLIAGGYTGDVTTDTAELYDPASETFMLLPPMTSPRQLNTATLLPSGKVLLAGGYTVGPVSNTAELFDPALGTFTSLLPNTMTSAHAEHTATLLPSGKVLIAGGDTGASPLGSGTTNIAELFDSVSGSFTPAASLGVARFFPTATLLPDGKVLIAGGEPGTGPTTTAELFDPASGTFSLLSNTMNVPRYRHTATLLTNGKVLIVGGQMTSIAGGTDAAELFDPASGTFTLLPPMTSPRWTHTATFLPNGKVLITGGLISSDYIVTNTAELFDPVSNTFTAVGSMSVRRDLHAATLLANGKVLIAGGFNPNSGGLDTAEIFDPASNTFTLLPNLMTTKRHSHSSTLLPDGQVFIAGGSGSEPPTSPVITGSVITNTAELFDPVTGTFTPLSNTMNSYRYWQTATLLPSGKVLLAAGSTIDYAGAEYTMTAELFDPSAKTFTLLPLMNSVRFGHTATLLPSGQVLIAAGTTGSVATNTTEIFDADVGFSAARRPVILTAPDLLIQPASLVLTGIGFRGDSEASGGSFSSSATNYPLLQLQRIDNEQIFFPLSNSATNWSDTTFSSEFLGNIPIGQYRVTIFTNAIPSFQKIINIGNSVQLVAAVSRKTHALAGTFDTDLPLTGTGIECRSGGANGDHTVVFTFANALTGVGEATVSGGTGSVSESAIGSDAHQYVVNLTGVGNAQVITVSVSNVHDADGNSSASISAAMRVLLGDTTGSGAVNSSDISQTKSQSGQAVTSSNFRQDVTVSGSINSSDISLVKSKSGSALP